MSSDFTAKVGTKFSSRTIFLQKEPFPLTYEIISQTENIEILLKQTLNEHGLTRYINRISQFFKTNIERIETDNWSIIKVLERLKDIDSKIEEQLGKLDDRFEGFGPKQSRNFLQTLGLTKYEIQLTLGLLIG